jgi:hypothetical protein
MRSTNNNGYVIVGPTLLLLYALQYIFNAQADALAVLQNDIRFKFGTGLLLLLLILLQWILAFARTSNLKQKYADAPLSFHKWVGATSPLYLYIHSIQMGNGYLAILTFAFIFNLALGFLSMRNIKSLHILYFKTWSFLHILFSVIVLVLVLFHIAMVLYFE